MSKINLWRSMSCIVLLLLVVSLLFLWQIKPPARSFQIISIGMGEKNNKMVVLWWQHTTTQPQVALNSRLAIPAAMGMGCVRRGILATVSQNYPAVIRRWQIDIHLPWSRVDNRVLKNMDAFKIRGLTCSPSGRWVTFAVVESDIWTVYLMDWHNGSPHKMTQIRDRNTTQLNLACRDDGGVYICSYSLNDYGLPRPTTLHHLNKKSSVVGYFHQVLTTQSGDFGLEYRRSHGEVGFALTTLSSPALLKENYKSFYYQGISSKPADWGSVACSEDGQYWCWVVGAPPTGFWSNHWNTHVTMMIWRRGQEEPAYTLDKMEQIARDYILLGIIK